ncbi:MAG: mechanosensitive ion channel family protein [Flavobacteriales bacterium]|jgi:miniconductance mechanosensitive channel|uniref:mechanosensitive ion channel family protein n=1 Tax=Candidatus Ulvibacter alkanivorans TaxID=2267620 RepID=UPI000DF36804|nr:mechanosensitive ion channel domain-containing protein [Candidatus Ulvibacter alkanivorans]MCH2489013.1 mechanosensitive ion channel family protein [Flavobacteriales bacterium]
MDENKLLEYSCLLQEYFVNLGMVEWLAVALNTLINCLLVIVAVTFLDIIVRKVIVQGFKAFSNKTVSTFDDHLVQSNFPKYIAHFVPLAIVWYLLPILFIEYPLLLSLLLVGIDLYLIALSVYVFRSILRSTRNFLRTKEEFQDKPLESYMQVLMMFAWGVAIFLIINLLTGYSITSLATLGAASAIVLLIFKDTILGFVASIQVSVNDIVRIGDWITFSKYGADGYVTEINLATVRVQNFDNTFTTIPTYSLIADSFQNWRGMQESKGRRIKRAIFIKQNSVKFLTHEDIKALEKIQLIKPYLEHRERDVAKYNKQVEADKSLLINGKNQTNLGVFRKYADAFLHENPAINKELFLMVRHLAPTDKGIPIEVFCFSYDKNWENYEHIQADIFDHLIAAVPYFGLELYESPSSKDLNKLISNVE